MKEHVKSKIMNEGDLGRTIARLAYEILEKKKSLENIVKIGMRKIGA